MENIKIGKNQLNVGGVGWYRVTKVPGWADVFVALEFQSDFYGKNVFLEQGKKYEWSSTLLSRDF